MGDELGVTGADEPRHGGMARAVSLLFALLLGACAGVLPGVAPDLKGIRNVGIITAFGDMFHVQKVGITVFGSDFKEFSVASWGIDDMVIGKVRTLLGRRFNVKPVNYQKSVFATSKWGGIGAMVQEAVSPAGVNSYVVLTKGVSKVGATNQFVSGLGILGTSGGLIGSDKQTVHALYYVTLVDGREFSRLGSTPSLLPGEAAIDPIRMTFLKGPHREVDQ